MKLEVFAPVQWLQEALSQTDFITLNGKVEKIIGLTIESAGPEVFLGEVCVIRNLGGARILCEVVGFKDNRIILMPLEEFEGVSLGCPVSGTKHTLDVGVGEDMLSRVFDGIGRPIDGKPFFPKSYVSLNNSPPNPLVRARIKEPLPVGVRAIDAFTTLGQGQRIGIFSGSGVGKSTTMGMIARNTRADVNVIGLIGERGREVREFIERDLGEEGLRRSTVVVSTSDQPALMRVKALYTSTSIAEYFRDRGLNVMLMVDSLTRWSMAQRELGLAIGEPPTTRGYPPSVFAGLPKVLERAGNSDKGSITGIYTVLVEGDDFNEPISDTVRGIVDGHIILSRKLAEGNHFPAIDVLASISRLMPEVADKEHLKAARTLKDLISTYYGAKDLIDVGAYKEGSDTKIDQAKKYILTINGFLRQEVSDKAVFEETLEKLKKILQTIQS
ncbi:MAG TPA: flagellar protein export ATPase FliI [Thermotogota bacterium]|nr:flagellar protein export ATPase FliI [Thermotogota bacterium]NLZ13615.1 flagellar protein export ATPase FliI [Thermotogaceae bacterium]MDD8040613.1 flagellar protein export ATPase FliI [Thermotogota bacterium]HNR63058.1 flagellar protein export ATPase FliI [Thermotogota bacterium]HNT95208.1 flagellar protein export ATPase FliI [Thermotogota bacterium]